MLPESEPTSNISGLSVLLLLLRFHGISVDAKQLTHQYGDSIGTLEMLRSAKDLKLKARAIDSNWGRLAKTALPAIAQRQDGGFFLVSKATATGVLILDPVVGHPQLINRADLESQWNGRLILMTRRASLGYGRRFDITWFLQAMVNTGGCLAKYS
jgi:subfamily B ATP-binding cassette protein HlyB/CyaB